MNVQYDIVHDQLVGVIQTPSGFDVGIVNITTGGISALNALPVRSFCLCVKFFQVIHNTKRACLKISYNLTLSGSRTKLESSLHLRSYLPDILLCFL